MRIPVAEFPDLDRLRMIVCKIFIRNLRIGQFEILHVFGILDIAVDEVHGRLQENDQIQVVVDLADRGQEFEGADCKRGKLRDHRSEVLPAVDLVNDHQ